MIYADPGYMGPPRLPLDSPERIIAAYARMTFEYHGYTVAQRESIRARIRRAATTAGLDLSGMDRRNARKIAVAATNAETADGMKLSSIDIKFLDDMIVNHQEGIDIAKPYLAKPSEQRLPAVTEMANETITVHTEDIAEMKQMKKGIPPDDTDMAAVKVHCIECNTDYFIDSPEDKHQHATIDEAAANHVGCMIALYPVPAVQEALAVAGGEAAKDIHLTLAYLGDAAGLDIERLKSVVAGVAEGSVPMAGEISGFGVFTAAPEHVVTYASADVPALAGFRQRLFDALVAASFPVATNHGYTPHMTLAYKDQRELKVPNLKLTFDAVWLVAAGEKTKYELRGDEKPYNENQHGAPEPAGDQTAPLITPQTLWQPNLTINMGPPTTTASSTNTYPREPVLPVEDEVVSTKAFVTEVNGKTIITAPIQTVKAELGSNPHFLWLEGAFVGAEEPNRNNAFWSTADLQFGEATVKNGPLNWLHEARHVIGSITDGRLVLPADTAAAAAKSGAAAVPHIRATAAVWKWIYQEEAQVIEFAAEVGKLYFSMECISKSIKCAGDGGCGESYDYMKAMKGQACEHIINRSSIRQLENPTFLGGAILVPPVRPGWAHADVSLLKQAAKLAEKSYEDAGRPDMEASVWEQLMREVVLFSRG